MGMSNDYEIAVEEGATMVRIGTALVGNEIRRCNIMSIVSKVKTFFALDDEEYEYEEQLCTRRIGRTSLKTNEISES